jgi:stearoyl-CoA desaturase (delta-9 desaturase)
MTVAADAGTAPRAGGRSRLPVTVALTPSRRRLFRSVTGAVIVAPLVGTIVAFWLAATSGVATGSIAACAFGYCLTTMGITIGYHRYFCHRSFRTGRLMDAVFVVAGSMAAQGSLLYWVSTHRRHHQFSDAIGDPHSPHVGDDGRLGRWSGLWHAHIGWMFSPKMTNAIRYAPDIIRDPFILRLQQRYALWTAVGLVLPAVLGGLVGGNWYTVLEVFLWAGPVRLFFVHNASWAVGSISHMYGRRPFVTDDDSRNNLLMAVIAFGEGLQNNHHAFPKAARQAIRWWEPDLNGWIIALLAYAGLVWDVNRPTAHALTARRRKPQSALPTIEEECPHDRSHIRRA